MSKRDYLLSKYKKTSRIDAEIFALQQELKTCGEDDFDAISEDIERLIRDRVDLEIETYEQARLDYMYEQGRDEGF